MTYFWFRRDLRLQDNAGLYHALKENENVQPVFIFDKNILDKLKSDDRRVTFIHQTIHNLNRKLNSLGSSIKVYYGSPIDIWKELIQQSPANIYTNRDYEPYALKRDEQISELMTNEGLELKTFKDHVIFEKDEVLKKDGTPYTVFTPYSKKWKAKLLEKTEIENEVQSSFYFKTYPTEKYFSKFNQHQNERTIPSLESMGFESWDGHFPPQSVTQGIIKNYSQQRDFPALDATSKLGIHFRFGTISIREKARKASTLNETFLNELIWRDFYAQILQAFPHIVNEPFREKYKHIEWRNNESEFKIWCEGKTGYPMVDAGMRQLNETGYMHNRVRMVVASFLTKHLLIDWRWGEQYFADKLLDFDLASNNGGWQWASGTGTDAAPYFRIFNPTSQLEKFDKELKYIKEWISEYGTSHYPKPMVDHSFARKRCLEVYKKGLGK